MFEFKFKVGDDDILPAYENSETNRITSTIEIEFSKSFEDDLGTGKTSGEEVACLGILGIELSTTGKLTCKIYPALFSYTYTVIHVTGYDRILSGTDVMIRIAGLKSLKANVEDFIKIGVSLAYYNYGGAKGYIYEPTGTVVQGTTAPISYIDIDPLTVTETSTNFVGDLVNYTFTGTIGAGFATVDTDDYVVVEFEENVFEGTFSRNL